MTSMDNCPIKPAREFPTEPTMPPSPPRTLQRQYGPHTDTLNHAAGLARRRWEFTLSSQFDAAWRHHLDYGCDHQHADTDCPDLRAAVDYFHQHRSILRTEEPNEQPRMPIPQLTEQQQRAQDAANQLISQAIADHQQRAAGATRNQALTHLKGYPVLMHESIPAGQGTSTPREAALKCLSHLEPEMLVPAANALISSAQVHALLHIGDQLAALARSWVGGTEPKPKVDPPA